MALKAIKSGVRSVTRRIIKLIPDEHINNSMRLQQVDPRINDSPNLSAKLYSLAGSGSDYLLYYSYI
ncbi:MAG: hypothetical protein M3342_07450 [Bacteroidota bacterium]|nr:hypothetical protein [Flavisolibacter sp.]MDQ3843835.1 hypothetical protein [Bacteroidota bacterium]